MSIALTKNRICAMSDSAIQRVRDIETWMLTTEQTVLPIHHTLHGGVYSRSLMLPAGVAIAGALIKVPTTLIVSGHVSVFANDQWLEIAGYKVIAASAGRKQIFIAHTDTDITAFFATRAKTVREAEAEFTDEHEQLASRGYEHLNFAIITGE